MKQMDENISPKPKDDDTDLRPLFDEREQGHGLLKRTVLLLAGIILILAGLVVWLTPIIGGAPLLYLLGGILLAGANRHIARWLNVQEQKLPNKLRRFLRLTMLRKQHHPDKAETTEPKTYRQDVPGQSKHTTP